VGGVNTKWLTTSKNVGAVALAMHQPCESANKDKKSHAYNMPQTDEGACGTQQTLNTTKHGTKNIHEWSSQGNQRKRHPREKKRNVTAPFATIAV